MVAPLRPLITPWMFCADAIPALSMSTSNDAPAMNAILRIFILFMTFCSTVDLFGVSGTSTNPIRRASTA
jgi:hypothetical protein